MRERAGTAVPHISAERIAPRSAPVAPLKGLVGQLHHRRRLGQRIVPSMPRRRRSPTPDDFDEQLERLRELSTIDDRLRAGGAGGPERSRLLLKRGQIRAAVDAWNLRFVPPGLVNGNGV